MGAHLTSTNDQIKKHMWGSHWIIHIPLKRTPHLGMENKKAKRRRPQPWGLSRGWGLVAYREGPPVRTRLRR